MAHSLAPCRVITQQSPQSGLRQRAHGPAAKPAQLAHRSKAAPPPPVLLNCPVMTLSAVVGLLAQRDGSTIVVGAGRSNNQGLHDGAFAESLLVCSIDGSPWSG
jgi:hypothetical protein